MEEGKQLIVMCPADRKPYKTYISFRLENMQKIVHGNIETFRLSEDVLVICNDEGWIRGMQENRTMPDFAGDIFLCSWKGDELTGLSEEQADKWFATCKVAWWSEMGIHIMP